MPPLEPRAGLQGLAKQSLREQAGVALRRAITSGELAQGTHLVETELADKLQISRGTLREALRQLQQEGLVEQGPRGRISVRSLSNAEIGEIFEVRAALESLAAVRVAGRADTDIVAQELESILTDMDQARSKPLAERIEVDLHFHRQLCVLAGNDTLVRSWDGLEGSIRMSIMFAGVERGVDNMAVERHREIVDAILTGDELHVRSVIEQHMHVAVDHLMTA